MWARYPGRHGARAELSRHRGHGWVQVASGEVAKGLVGFAFLTPKRAGTYHYRALVAGHGHGHAKRLTIKVVKPRMTLTLPSQLAGDGLAVAEVRSTPVRAGKVIGLRVKSGRHGNWRTVAQAVQGTSPVVEIPYDVPEDSVAEAGPSRAADRRADPFTPFFQSVVLDPFNAFTLLSPAFISFGIPNVLTSVIDWFKQFTSTLFSTAFSGGPFSSGIVPGPETYDPPPQETVTATATATATSTATATATATSTATVTQCATVTQTVTASSSPVPCESDGSDPRFPAGGAAAVITGPNASPSDVFLTLDSAFTYPDALLYRSTDLADGFCPVNAQFGPGFGTSDPPYFYETEDKVPDTYYYAVVGLDDDGSEVTGLSAPFAVEVVASAE